MEENTKEEEKKEEELPSHSCDGCIGGANGFDVGGFWPLCRNCESPAP